MSKRKEFSDKQNENNEKTFTRIIPEFKSEYDIIRQEKGHKQFCFVCVFLYDKRMNKFILESRGTSNSQYKKKVSTIGRKRDRYFAIMKKTVNEIGEQRSFKKIKLEIDKEEFTNAINSPDGFAVVKLVDWNAGTITETTDVIFIEENEYDMIYTQEDIFCTMVRETYEESGLDVKKVLCEIRYFGIDKKIFESDKIVTHVYLVVFDSYDFIPYSKESKKGNSLISMNPSEIMKQIKEDQEKPNEEMYFTPTIYNVFKEVKKYCKPLKQEIILFEGLHAGLSEGIKRCVDFFSSIGLEVSSTLTLPETYCEQKNLKNKHQSVRDMYPGYFDTGDSNKETQQMRILLAYDSIGKLLRGETEPDVGNAPVVILERSQRCVNLFNSAFGTLRLPLSDMLKAHDPN